MKKLNLILSLFLCGIISSQAQHLGSKKITGNGKIKTITRTTNDYDIIRVLGNLDVELIHGTEGAIEIEAEENLLEYIKTKVIGTELTIRVKKGYRLRPSLRKRIAITVPFEHINKVTLSGSGDVESTNVIKTKHFSTAVSGSGDINLNVVSQRITADVAGSGDLKLYGRTDHFDVSVSGSGDVSAYELTANTAEVSVAGSGDVRLYVNESLDASVAGSGDIRYKGNPMNVDKSIVGSGDISKQ
jgi:hypothetical protein